MTVLLVIFVAIGFEIVILNALYNTRATLTNLRRNCFLTDERGVRIRYEKCSAEVRARAEDA